MAKDRSEGFDGLVVQTMSDDPLFSGDADVGDVVLVTLKKGLHFEPAGTDKRLVTRDGDKGPRQMLGYITSISYREDPSVALETQWLGFRDCSVSRSEVDSYAIWKRSGDYDIE